jgi:hypothetical protein
MEMIESSLRGEASVSHYERDFHDNGSGLLLRTVSGLTQYAILNFS